MGVVSTTTYKNIAADYSAAATQLDGLTDNYYDAAYEIVILTVFDPEIDLLTPFYNAYLASTTVYGSTPASIIRAVRSLQEHILRRAISLGNSTVAAGDRFTDVNDYYADIGTFVGILGQGFADVSALAGHTILATYTG